MESPKRCIPHVLPVLLIGVGSVIRVLVCFQHNPMDYLVSDMMRHWGNGLNFPRGGYFGAADPIVYQLYIWFVQKLVGTNRALIALSASMLSLAMPWTYYRATREFGLAKTPALWTWALIACTPSLFTLYHFIMMETLLLFVEGLALWATAHYLRKGGATGFLLLVVSWTIACLTKPTIAPLAAVCVLWSWWKKTPSVREMVFAIIAVIILLLPQAIRTKVELGFFAPFGNPWLTRIQHRSGAKFIHVTFHDPHHYTIELDYISPTCLIRPMRPLSDWAIRRAFGSSVVRVSADYRNGSRDWSDAYNSLDVGWDEWLAQWGENIVVMLFAPSWPESVYPLWDGELQTVTRWMWAPLIAVVLIWNAYMFVKGRFHLLPVAVTIFALLLILQNVVTAEGRYRKPLEPLLLMNLVWLISTRGGDGQDKLENLESAE